MFGWQGLAAAVQRWAVTGAIGLAASAASSTPAATPDATMTGRVSAPTTALDATIASLVHRGLLTDVTETAPQSPTRGPVIVAARPPQPTRSGTAAKAPAPDEAGTWRVRSILKRGAAATPGTTAPPATPSSPSSSAPEPAPSLPALSPANLTPPAHAVTPTPADEGPTLQEPGGDESAAADQATDQLEEQEPRLAAALPAAPLLSGLSTTADVDAQDADAAASEVSPEAAPQLADPAPDDESAEIDELPETPAPADDGPGDGRVDDLGEAKEEAPAAGAAEPTPAVPLGEPDRIEVPRADAQPVDPREFHDPEPAAPARRLPPLSASQQQLRAKLRRVLKYYYDRPLSAADRSPWEVMHMMLAYEVHSRIRQPDAAETPITAVGWLCFNQPCKGRTLMYLNEDKQLRVKVGPALQGHTGQLLALLAQARVRQDYPLKVEGRDFTIADLIAVEQATCYPRTELTFKLIGMLHYLPADAQWANDQGMSWNFAKVVDEELQQPIRTAACGGCHRLSGLTLAVKKRRQAGLPINGEFARAEQFVANYRNYAYRLQNGDGSFSTEWFRGPGDEPDVDRRLKTTGHTLEWLLYSGAPEQTSYYRTVRAVNYLANILWANRARDWEAGPLGHALHALVVYDRQAFAPYDPAGASASGGEVAAPPQTPTAAARQATSPPPAAAPPAAPRAAVRHPAPQRPVAGRPIAAPRFRRR